MEITREIIKEQLKTSREIYELRKNGITEQWSATTKCGICGDWWLWGIEDNLDFICPVCEREIKEEELIN